MVGHFRQMLSNGLTGALILHFSEDVRPTVFKEVEGGLTVERKHGKPVSGGHAVSKEFHAVTWSSVGHNWLSLRELGDSHDSVLAASEDASVWGVWRCNELHQSSRANWVRSLDSSNGHGVRDGVERKVHVLLEEALELGSDVEWLGSAVLNDILPDNLLLAVGGKGLIFWGVKVVLDLQLWATVCIMLRGWLVVLRFRLVVLRFRLVVLRLRLVVLRLRSVLLLMLVALGLVSMLAQIVLLSLSSSYQKRDTRCESHVSRFSVIILSYSLLNHFPDQRKDRLTISLTKNHNSKLTVSTLILEI